MMKITEPYQQTAYRVVKCICDRCEKEVVEKPGSYSTRHFDLEFREGYNYGHDGGEVTGWSVSDLCDECVAWLKELLIEHSVKITQTDDSW